MWAAHGWHVVFAAVGGVVCLLDHWRTVAVWSYGFVLGLVVLG